MSNWFSVLKIQVLDNATDLNINMDPMEEDKEDDCCEIFRRDLLELFDEVKMWWEMANSPGFVQNKDIDSMTFYDGIVNKIKTGSCNEITDMIEGWIEDGRNPDDATVQGLFVLRAFDMMDNPIDWEQVAENHWELDEDSSLITTETIWEVVIEHWDKCENGEEYKTIYTRSSHNGKPYTFASPDVHNIGRR